MAITATGAENNANMDVRWGRGLPFTHSLILWPVYFSFLFFPIISSVTHILILVLVLGLIDLSFHPPSAIT